MLATLILLASGATTPSGGTIVDIAAARRARGAPVAAATQARMSEHAARGASDALADELRRVLADPKLEPVAREWLLESGISALRSLPPTSASRAIARELAARAPRVYRLTEPEHGRRLVPLYDVGAAARYAQRHWIRGETRAAAARSLRLGTGEALEAWLRHSTPRDAAVREGILDAFDAADTATLQRQRAAVVAAMRAGRELDRLALALARRLRDAELASLTIGYADPAVALDAVRVAAQILPAEQALALLAEAANREPIASAALLAIGRLAASQSQAQQLLLDRLADPANGDSAAAALAASDDPGLAIVLGARLEAAGDEFTRRRIALALRLNGSATAREALARLVASKQGSAELRREVAAWLARGR